MNDSDFYQLALLLDPAGRQLLHRVGESMEKQPSRSEIGAWMYQ
jgi:hypothetical protein